MLKLIQNLNFKQIALVSLAFHIIIAIFSSGFHHFDEHFQIYEFLNLKLGSVGPDQLAWEYKHQIRPWSQVLVYYLLAKPLTLIGFSNPFYLAMFFRLVTSILGWASLVYSFKLIKKFIPETKWQKLAFLIINFSWFVPYIHTRTNAESFMATFFIFGMTLFLTEKESLKNIFFSAILLGASYTFRHQGAIMVASLWFWALIIARYPLKNLFIFALGIIIMIISGVLVDYWGYGNWTFSPWNLVNMNFFEGVLKSMGESPWYEYFRTSLNRGIPPISLVFIISTLYFWIKKPKHPLTWVSLPFFVIHTFIGHKELRFIFPVILISTYMLGILAFENKEKIESFLKFARAKYFYKPIIYINLFILILTLFRPANPSVNFYKFVYDKNIKRIYTKGESPYIMVSLPLNFYKAKSLEVLKYEKFNDLDSNENFYVFFNRGHHLKSMDKYTHCKMVYLTYPKWSLKLNVGNWVSRSRVWSLFECKN